MAQSGNYHVAATEKFAPYIPIAKARGFTALSGKYKKGFHRYLGEICTGRGGAEVFEECIGKISEIEPAYLKYIRRLKPDTRLSIR